MNIFAWFWLIENAVLTVYAFVRIRNKPEQLRLIYQWGFLNGAFVYEDQVIFGLFHIGSVLVGLGLGDMRYFYLLFLLFWIVRSAGETLYFFLQQFIEPSHYPHAIDQYFDPLKSIFGKLSLQSCFILMQVIHQTIVIVSLFLLILFLWHW